MSLTDQERAALRMLAAAIRGQSLSTMLARGFTIETLQGLVSAGLATANRDASARPGRRLHICGLPKQVGRRPPNDPVTSW
jgi:hypothetical protein